MLVMILDVGTRTEPKRVHESRMFCASRNILRSRWRSLQLASEFWSQIRARILSNPDQVAQHHWISDHRAIRALESFRMVYLLASWTRFKHVSKPACLLGTRTFSMQCDVRV